MVVHSHVPGRAGRRGTVFPRSARSSRTASAWTRFPKPTTTVISMTSAVGWKVTTRRTRGCWPAESCGPSRWMRSRARSVVHGASWRGDRDPASVSASTWANWLGHAADGAGELGRPPEPGGTGDGRESGRAGEAGVLGELVPDDGGAPGAADGPAPARPDAPGHRAAATSAS